MFDEPIDFKEQMVETRRMQILMGASQVFAEKGYHQATTKEIAKAAGVSEGTIYNYFKSKRDLLVAMIDSIGMQSIKNIFVDHPPEDPREFFTDVLTDRYQIAQRFGRQMAPILAEMFTDAELRKVIYQQIVMPLANYMENYVQVHVESGRFRQIESVVATRALVGAVIVNFALKISKLDPRYEDISEEELIEQVVSIFLHGLLADEDCE